MKSETLIPLYVFDLDLESLTGQLVQLKVVSSGWAETPLMFQPPAQGARFRITVECLDVVQRLEIENS